MHAVGRPLRTRNATSINPTDQRRIKAFPLRRKFQLRNLVNEALRLRVGGNDTNSAFGRSRARKRRFGAVLEVSGMENLLYHATTIAVLAVLAVLVLGLYSMLKGTSPNTSQKLMRWRVGLQFFAILIIIAFLNRLLV